VRGAGGRGGTDMPQLGSGGGDDLGATDEMLAFKDEGEQEEKIPENAFTERDLADLKSSLVNESEGSGSPARDSALLACSAISQSTNVWINAPRRLRCGSTT